MRIKRIKSIQNIASLAILAIAAGLAGCQTRVAKAQAKPKIVATHNVICDLVNTIAQDTVDLTCLIDADQDPHTYRPKPSHRQAVESAQLIFYGGYELEPQVTKLLQATEKSVPKIAIYEQVVAEPIMAEHSEHSEEEHSEHSKEEHAEHSGEEHSEHSEEEHSEHSREEHSEEEHSTAAASAKANLEPDPHVWHSVENTVAMVELIKSLFLQANPTAAETYLQNSQDLTTKLWQLDAWIKEQIATVPEGQRVLVTTHDSLNYYVQAYQLEDYKTLQGLSSQTSPTATQVRELASEIRQAGVSTIFAESTQSDRVISNVAKAGNAELSPEKLYADGLGESSNYLTMMSHNTCAIVNGLGGKCQAFADGN